MKSKNKIFNKYIPIGTNCFVRVTLVHLAMKARRIEGELSFPFDLSITPIESVEKLLHNNFSDFFTDLKYLPDSKFWNNTKYNITYPHDKDINTLDEFINRYTNRIKNFREI